MNGSGRRVGYRAGLWAMLSPFLVGAVALVVIPVVATSYFAFTRYDAITPARFVGLDVFRDLLRYPELRSALVSTGVFLAIAVPLRIAGGLALALLMHRRERLAVSGRVAVYAPSVVPEPATALVWLWIVNPVYGPVGLITRAVGETPSPVLLSTWGARLTIIAIAVFAVGEGFLVTLAARRELPTVLYDVARAEGAGAWAAFRRVTLPGLAPVLGLLSARDLLTSMQVTLVPTLLLTRGGPLNATKTLPVLIYERGFRELRFGDAAALALVLTVVTGLLVALQLRLLRRWSPSLRAD
ncbi:MAG TPA: sugar ABC transporter permease [Mycobacteriales bacterium]|nr:sugar ABC transporter permease [Mycobacteriales bacterium]